MAFIYYLNCMFSASCIQYINSANCWTIICWKLLLIAVRHNKCVCVLSKQASNKVLYIFHHFTAIIGLILNANNQNGVVQPPQQQQQQTPRAKCLLNLYRMKGFRFYFVRNRNMSIQNQCNN